MGYSMSRAERTCTTASVSHCSLRFSFEDQVTHIGPPAGTSVWKVTVLKRWMGMRFSNRTGEPDRET